MKHCIIQFSKHTLSNKSKISLNTTIFIDLRFPKRGTKTSEYNLVAILNIA